MTGFNFVVLILYFRLLGPAVESVSVYQTITVPSLSTRLAGSESSGDMVSAFPAPPWVTP